MHSSIQVNIRLIFHDQANQQVPNKSASLSSGKCTPPAYSLGTWALLPRCLLRGRGLSGSLLLPPCFHLLQLLLSPGHWGLSSPGSRSRIFIYMALSTHVPSLLWVLQMFSLWFSKTPRRRWKFRSLMLRDLVALLEATASFEDGLVHLSPSMPKLWLPAPAGRAVMTYLGCLRSKRKQRS